MKFLVQPESIFLQRRSRVIFVVVNSTFNARAKTFKFLGVAGGAIERSCYSPHYVNTERDYERDYQATLPQGRKAAGGCKPRYRHGP